MSVHLTQHDRRHHQIINNNSHMSRMFPDLQQIEEKHPELLQFPNEFKYLNEACMYVYKLTKMGTLAQ